MVDPAFRKRRGKLGSAPAEATATSPETFEVASESPVDLGELWAALVENYRFMLAVGAMLFALVLALTMFSSMTFKSSGRLYLGELEMKRLQTTSSGALDLSGNGAGDVSSELEILKSYTLVGRAIGASGFNVSIAPRGWKRPRFWQWLLSSRNQHTLDGPVRQIASRNTSLHDNSRGEQTYTVSFQSETGYELLDERGKLLGKGRLGLPLVVPGLSLTLAPGSDRRPHAGEVYDMIVRPLDATADAVLSKLTVSAPKASAGDDPAKVVTLEFTDASPFRAATLLRALMHAYLRERQSWKTEDASAAERFVTKQLGTLRDSLDKTERRLAEYRSNNPVVVLDNEARAMVEQIGKYEEQRLSARLEVAGLSEMRRVLRTQSLNVESFLIGETRDSVLEDLSTKLSRTRTELSDAESQFGTSSPQAQQARARVNASFEMMRNYVSSRLARAQESLSALNRLIEQFEEKLKTVPGAELGLAQLGRESEVYSRVYSYMLERQQQAAITKASTVSKNRVLDNPQVPYREDSPRLSLRLASGPLALLFGALLVVVQRLLSGAFHSENEIRRAISGLPIFSALPKRPVAASEVGDPVALDLASSYAEGLRTLSTNIYHTVTSTQGRAILMTSPNAGDGKTTSLMSLAAILAADQKRVLIVDADMRKPSHHEIFGQPLAQGLRSVLSGQSSWRDAVKSVRLAVGSFDSLAAGRMAPAELLSSERMTRFLNEVRSQYDFILIDSPSFPIVADPLVLSVVVDCVLTVLRPHNTQRKLAAEHINKLSEVALNYGIIINDSAAVGSVYPVRAKESAYKRLLGLLVKWVNTPHTRVIWLRIWSTLCGVVIAAALLTMIFADRAQDASTGAQETVTEPLATPLEFAEPSPLVETEDGETSSQAESLSELSAADLLDLSVAIDPREPVAGRTNDPLPATEVQLAGESAGRRADPQRAATPAAPATAAPKADVVPGAAPARKMAPPMIPAPSLLLPARRNDPADLPTNPY